MILILLQHTCNNLAVTLPSPAFSINIYISIGKIWHWFQLRLNFNNWYSQLEIIGLDARSKINIFLINTIQINPYIFCSISENYSPHSCYVSLSPPGISDPNGGWLEMSSPIIG